MARSYPMMWPAVALGHASGSSGHAPPCLAMTSSSRFGAGATSTGGSAGAGGATGEGDRGSWRHGWRRRSGRGGRQRRLTSHARAATHRVLAGTAASVRQIFSMRLDGTGIQQVTDTGMTCFLELERGWIRSSPTPAAVTCGSRTGMARTPPADDQRGQRLPTSLERQRRVRGVRVRAWWLEETSTTRPRPKATPAPVTQVTDGAEEATFPQFSPDGQWITYTNYASGDIYKVRTDGTESTNLTNYPGTDYCSAYCPTAPRSSFRASATAGPSCT